MLVMLRRCPRRVLNTLSGCCRALTVEAARPLPAIYNALSRSREPLPVGDDGTLCWYTCGPTVYDSAHLGHARCYVCLDIMRRVLQSAFRVDVRYAMGMTDIDDKLIARAAERERERLGLGGVHAQEHTEAASEPEGAESRAIQRVQSLARHYEREFMEDLALLGVMPPAATLRVSEHVPDIVDFITGIERRGIAYVVPGDGVYFDTRAFEAADGLGGKYGKLGAEAVASASAAPALDTDTDTDAAGKRDARDFALWKLSPPHTARSVGEGQLDELDVPPGWASPWGLGRPGWHIECSAMAGAIFGRRLDLHSGGIDLCFPHHCNEVAQCDAYYGIGTGAAADPHADEWCAAFVHTGHLHIEGLKMSKSLKNFISVRDFLFGDVQGEPNSTGRDNDEHARAADRAELFRLFCAMHHYTATLHYGIDRIRDARNVRAKLVAAVRACAAAARAAQDGSTATPRRWHDAEHELSVALSEARRRVIAALCDDIDTASVVVELQRLSAAAQSYVAECARRPHSCGGARAEVMLEVARYISDTLGMLGLGQDAEMRGTEFGRAFAELRMAEHALTGVDAAQVEPASSTSGVDPLVEAVTRSLVDFRAAVRQQALTLDATDDDSSGGDGARSTRASLLGLCDSVRASVLADAGIVLADTPTARGGEEVQRNTAAGAQTGKPQAPPKAQMQLRDAETYSAFDDDGVPTHDADGNELSKRARKKWQRKRERRMRKEAR